MTQQTLNAERQRLTNQRLGWEDWRLWGPYLAERAWGTVREDYSEDGTAWEYFDHDQARSRAYRWNEDGMGGICDEQQRLCLALALWNGQDAMLKERAFGLTGHQGSHGEDVKEYYFYRDATPSHSYLHYHYKYPQATFPYAELIETNARRSREEPPFSLVDSGVFDDSRYFDVEVFYAKVSPTDIHCMIRATNRGPETASLHVLPTLWYRNTWSWDASLPRPLLTASAPPAGADWAVAAEHPSLGYYYWYGKQTATLLFTENETNHVRLFASPNPTPYVKDAFHRRVLADDEDAVNPAQTGTKCAAWSIWTLAPGQSSQLELRLTDTPTPQPFAFAEAALHNRERDANVFYSELLPAGSAEDQRILRQALAGMIWSKQFYHYDVNRWLEGDGHPPPAARKEGRNAHWRHLQAADIISMPDVWEYPWFAAWDLGFHIGALALVDVDFAKDQIELMVSERYLHPNGQIPAYEWAFGDVNPPVHAMGALKAFRAERAQRGSGDYAFLERVFHKLLLNFAWWVNRKDSAGQNMFEGGFLGLDNISVYDRSEPLPPGYSLKQADATGWMAMFSLNLTVMALELCETAPNYETIAIQCYQQFLAIARVIAGGDETGLPSLWDPKAGFFKDLLVTPDAGTHRLDVYSLVGIIPLFATEVVDKRLLSNAPRFREVLKTVKGGQFQGSYVCNCPDWENACGEHLLALVDHSMLPRILKRLLNEDEFLSPYGIRSLSRVHAEHQDLGHIPGIGQALIEYTPGESTSGLFGGNSNWRGPLWMPINYALIQALEKFHRFLGPNFTLTVPGLADHPLTLEAIARRLGERLIQLYRQDEVGRIPALQRDKPFQDDPHWHDLYLFYEYFHADNGTGLGAAHQTGWSGLIAALIMRQYDLDITPWSGLTEGANQCLDVPA